MHLQSSELCARLTLAAPGHRLTWHVPFSPVTRGHGQPSGAGGGSPGRLVPRTHSASLSPADSLASRAPAPPFTPAPSERFNCARPTVLAWQSPGPLPPSLPPAPARVAPSGPVSGNSVLTIRELVRVTGLQAPPEQDPALPPFHQPPDRRQALGWCSPCSFHQLKIAVLRATDRRLGKRGLSCQDNPL